MKLAFIRHGESELNLANVFTGWLDPGLSETGYQEAKQAGKDLAEAGIEFDTVHTSVLTRAIQTCHIVLDEMERLYLPVSKNWRLNERHYGALQGLNKDETAEKYGDEQVHIWRRSYDVRPPEATGEQAFDSRYDLLDTRHMLAGECLKDTLERTIPYWEDHIAPDLKAGKNVLVVAHGNSLRSLTKYIEDISDEDIMGVEIATGEPIVYEINEDLEVISKEILHK